MAAGGAPTVTVKYRVYAREMSVRTNWVEADFAMINGAPTFLTLAGAANRPHEVVIEPARGWRTSMTSLPAMSGGNHRYRAADYDELVDSPILIGNPAVYEFSVDDKKHYLVNIGEAGVFDGAKAAKDLEAVFREQRRFWGSLPYDRYLVMNVLTAVPGQIPGGGLEHKNSTMLITGRWATRTRQSYLAWLELASHEIFHAWNVKRLRPVELGPFDYENENFTRSLWVVEGVTDYYGELLVHRAGLSSQVEYLDALANKIEEIQTTPGRAVQSAELASQDAWIKYYRPDENSPNSSVSYYTKGSVLGFLLDARIRKATSGAKSLDDVMRAAYQKFSGAKGYTPDEFRAVAEQVAGMSLASFWDAGVEGTAEVDYTEALDLFGLRFRPVEAPRADRARPRMARCHHPQRRRPAGGVAGPARRTRDRCRAQRGRRDHRHRRLPRARRSAGRPARSVQTGRQGHAARGAARSVDENRVRVRRRAGPAVASRGRSRRHRDRPAAARSVAQAAGMNFDPQYIDQVLNENFEDAKALFLPPLMAIQYAHLVMLADRGIVVRRRCPDAARRASIRSRVDDVRATPYDGRCEDLFFHVERLIVQACGEEAAGRLHTARSRNDIDMTMYRLRQREFILSLIEVTLDLREALIGLADRHRETLLAALTHTQPAQPTTIAHYMLAVIEQLERDAGRLRAAFASTNRSPLGACAITGTGFPIDRQRRAICSGSTARPATPTAASRPSITCSRARRPPQSCSPGSAGSCRTCCSGAPRSSAISGWPTASSSRAASCRRSATRLRWSMRAPSAARRSDRRAPFS